MRAILILVLFIGMSNTSKSQPDEKTIVRLQAKAVRAKSYCKKNFLSTRFCVLIDMKIHSGKKRFFLWDLKGDSVLKSGMCSHGICDNLDNNEGHATKFSNVPESHCSSLGKYRIGKRGWSSFGIHVNYKLHGLEKSNNKAFSRSIVFHSWGIPDEETYPFGIAQSWGCPAVSNNFMREMDTVLKAEKKAVLMWIYN
ncbi:MAG: murein L,D-transpeptidase catalytic domain family protein [Vicingaceae bacterium]|nr:murein L,D-transpeptidase catalytic domain family protein [Vicingaceae bacterium]